ncbi:hypothetical protein BGZ58_005710 [Dissophora ornata]|nr:hypothetical protein BGZ58_005710 [Dissophora ornata]
MTTLISTSPIALRNPFLPLEPELHHEPNIKGASSALSGVVKSAKVDDHERLAQAAREGDLDLSTWCVVNSTYLSEDEQSDGTEEGGQDGDEIYLWQPTSGDGLETTGSQESDLAPLRLSLSSDGFMNISKAILDHSTNSTLATAPERLDSWVVKVNKKCNKTRDESKPAAPAATSPLPADTNSTSLGCNSTQTLPMMDPSEKRKESIVDAQDKEKYGGAATYMSMTEHELSKSFNAVKIKNSRVATQHDRDLARALGCISEKTDEVDKKALRSRSCKSKTKSKTNNKANVFTNDF